MYFLFQKQDALFMDTGRNQDCSSWEMTYKNFKSGIAFFPSLTTSLKVQYETKHGFVFAYLFGCFYLTMSSCSNQDSKFYNIPLPCIQIPEQVTNDCDQCCVYFFLITCSDSIKKLKAKFWVKFMPVLSGKFFLIVELLNST